MPSSVINNQDVKNTLKLILRDLIIEDKSNYERIISDDNIKQLKKKIFLNSNALFLYTPNIIKKFLSRLELFNKPKSHLSVIDRIVDLRLSLKKKLGIENSDGRPKFLIRVDDFPRWDISSEEFKRFDEIFSKKGIPYLLGVTPFLSEEPLNPRCRRFRQLNDYDTEMINSMVSEGVEIALHGFSHKTIKENFHSELVGLQKEEIKEKINLSLNELKRYTTQIRVFIPPFNTFDFHSMEILGKYFKIICGGPESIPFVGFRLSPSYLNGCLYVPSYEPMYEKARVIYKHVKKLKELKEYIIIPITLHWAWEIKNDFEDVEKLLEEIKDYVIRWNSLLKLENA